MAGRPKLGDGSVTKVRLGDLRPAVEAFAADEGVALAEAVRRLIALALVEQSNR